MKGENNQHHYPLTPIWSSLSSTIHSHHQEQGNLVTHVEGENTKERWVCGSHGRNGEIWRVEEVKEEDESWFWAPPFTAPSSPIAPLLLLLELIAQLQLLTVHPALPKNQLQIWSFLRPVAPASPTWLLPLSFFFFSFLISFFQPYGPKSLFSMCEYLFQVHLLSLLFFFNC